MLEKNQPSKQFNNNYKCGQLTSIIPLITQGNEFNGETRVLNRATHVKT